VPYYEDDRLATESEADAQYARNIGIERPDQPWVLSDRDVWYPNPAYRGPAVRHPEDDQDDDTYNPWESWSAAIPDTPLMLDPSDLSDCPF